MFAGSLPAIGVYPATPIVGIAPAADGQGYWLASADGGVYAFGDAPYVGSMAAQQLAVAAPVTAIAASFSLPTYQAILSTTTDATNYAVGAPVTVNVTERNPSPYGCADTTISGDTRITDDAPVAVVSGYCGPTSVQVDTQSGQAVWQSEANAYNVLPPCPIPIPDQARAGGSVISRTFVWSQDTCSWDSKPGNGGTNPDCPQTQVPAGTYTVTGIWGNGQTSEPVTITIGGS